MADLGVTTRATKRYPEQPVSSSKLHDMLGDPYYVGFIIYKDDIYPGRHEPIITPELFERVLTHELVHAVIAGIAPSGVPTWLNEGLAQLLDGSDPQQARQRLKVIGRPIPLKELEHGFARLTSIGARIAYDESLLAVGVIADRPGFLWTRLLHRLGDGQPFEEAIRNFGLAYADLEASVAR